jgi:hypothetical protein
METQIKNTKTQAFVLTPIELERIMELFPDRDNLVIIIMSRDGVERKYKSLEEFLNFEHPPTQDITELLVMKFSKEFLNTTTIHFKNRD